MAHIFIQDDPKVSVGNANDDPATIPTPQQLGSLLVTYAATGPTGQFAAAYAALAIGGTAQWVPIAATGATGPAGPTGPTGTAAVDLTGTLGNDVPSGVGDPIGTRPLASTLADGSTFVATDISYFGRVYTHPTLGKMWYPTPAISQRSDVTATAGIATLVSKLGVYNPVTRVFTRATVAGQFCNARSASAQATPGGTVQVTIQPGTLFATIAVGAAFSIGDLMMTDANGEWVEYIDNGTNVPLAWMVSDGLTGTINAPAFEW